MFFHEEAGLAQVTREGTALLQLRAGHLRWLLHHHIRAQLEAKWVGIEGNKQFESFEQEGLMAEQAPGAKSGKCSVWIRVTAR